MALISRYVVIRNGNKRSKKNLITTGVVVTDAQIQKVADGKREGLTFNEISRKAGCKIWKVKRLISINSWLREGDYKMINRSNRQRPHSAIYDPTLDIYLKKHKSTRTRGGAFTLWERKFIQKHLSKKFYLTVKEMIRQLKCTKNSLWLEIRRNSENGLYDADRAEEKQKARKVNRYQRVSEAIRAIRSGYSIVKY